ncbi:hypothetical protein [Nonomuraea aridisoli]|uniref:Uncharacterized protein n=1 Tax=Nonomuraea aridisoli TaxID=2070368 RepID=A0A2W2F6B8_9ACTN|nr:hypothetical protein [Nonomuraea aridisoli]PZG20638.1 hypothetical protein C1J01_09050 [Nonomuraea aridisoli]
MTHRRWLATLLAHLGGRRTPLEAERALERPVELPDGAYPDGYSPPLDLLDVQLDRLAEWLWPDEEWRDIIRCPTPELTRYAHPRQARADTTRGGAQPRRCRCGGWHLRYPFPRRRRRRRRPRLPVLPADHTRHEKP